MFRSSFVSLAAVTVISATAMSLLLSPHAKASSILVDYGSVTYDPATQLQWLDITKTTGLTYDNVLNNKFGSVFVQDGWRYATQDEVEQMYRDGGLPVASNPGSTDMHILTSDPSQAGYATLEHDAFVLGNELGWTGFNGTVENPSFDTVGLFAPPSSADPDFASTSSLSLAAYLGNGPGSSVDVTEYFDALGRGQAVRNIGSFLVEDVSAVPIPGQATTLAAMLLGLIGFNLWRRKQLS